MTSTETPEDTKIRLFPHREMEIFEAPTHGTFIHAMEAEQALLGAMLQNNTVVHLVTARVSIDHFYEGLHSRIFNTIVTLVNEGKPASLLSIMPVMRDDATLQEVGGIKYLMGLWNQTCTVINAPWYADLIAETWVRRRSVEIAAEIQSAITDGRAKTAKELRGELESVSLSRSKDTSVPESIGAISNRVINQLNDAYQKGGTEKDYADCGLNDLKRAIGGWRRGRFYIIAGRPGMGKSTFSLSALLRTAQAGHGVMMFALEMGRQEITEMALCDLAWGRHDRIEYRDVSVSRVGDTDFEKRFDRIYQVSPLFNSLPFEIADRSGLTVPQIRAQAVSYDLKLKAQDKKLEVICIDHLGLIKASANYKGNKVAETEEVSADLKALAKDLDVAVVALAQLSRQVEQRDDKRPNLSDLRWSGGIEQDADCVMFVYREEYYLTKKQSDLKKEVERQERLLACQNKIEVLIEKQRGGPTLAMEFFCDIGCAVVRDAVHG